jgi:hypothetical protein
VSSDVFECGVQQTVKSCGNVVTISIVVPVNIFHRPLVDLRIGSRRIRESWDDNTVFFVELVILVRLNKSLDTFTLYQHHWT